MVCDLRNAWRSLKTVAVEASERLTAVQVGASVVRCWLERGETGLGRAGAHRNPEEGAAGCCASCSAGVSAGCQNTGAVLGPPSPVHVLCQPRPGRRSPSRQDKEALPPHRVPLSQADFKRALLKDVRAFVDEAAAFRADWEEGGPTVPGLDPMEASHRLRKFQQLFEVWCWGWGVAQGGWLWCMLQGGGLRVPAAV